MINPANDKIIWEDRYIPIFVIAKGIVLLVGITIITCVLMLATAFGMALIFLLIFLPFIKYYLDNKLYISITLTENNLYIKRTFIRKRRVFNLKEMNSISISIRDIIPWEKYAPVKFMIKILTLSGERYYSFIQAFFVPKERYWPLEVTKKMRVDFKQKLQNLSSLFPKFIFIEEKAPIIKRKAYFPSYLKGKI